MIRFRYALAMTCIISILSMTSCSKPSSPDNSVPAPEPENNEKPPVEPEEYPYAENTYVIMEDGDRAFRSTAIMMVGENLAIAASPEEGYSDVTSIMENCSEFFYIAVSPVIAHKGQFDLLTESSVFTIISTLNKAPIETLAPGETDEISSGQCAIWIEDGTVTMKGEIILTDNTWLGLHITADESADSPLEINENIIGRGDEEKPLRTAFYKEEGSRTYLFFTPGNISYFEELSIVTWYAYLVLPTGMTDGNIQNISDMAASQDFMFGIVDNLNPEKGFDLTSADLEEWKGSLCIRKVEDGRYEASISLVNDGIYKIYFNGECISCDIEAPVIEKETYFVCGDDTPAILSAELAKGEEVWTLTLDLDNGKAVEITMSESFWANGGTFGFSQDKNMAVTYDGTTYSKANGHSGTLTMIIDEENEIVETEFTNYKDCELYYYGKYTIR